MSVKLSVFTHLLYTRQKKRKTRPDVLSEMVATTAVNFNSPEYLSTATSHNVNQGGAALTL